MENRKRAHRMEIHEPTTVHSGASTFDVELRDISLTGAAIEFDLGSKKTTSFDIGRPVDLDVTEDDRQSGRVIRHYDGGFAMTFDPQEPSSE